MERKLGFGIIGTGSIANFHANCIEKIDNANLLGVYSKSQARANQVAENFNCPVFWDMEKLLSNPNIDIICVCNESGLHSVTIDKIAKSGKHVLCEKPLETSIEKIDKIAAIVKSSGIQLGCVFQNRENPEYKNSNLIFLRGLWEKFYCVKQVLIGIVLQVITKVRGEGLIP